MESYFNQASFRYRIPRWLISGILYNETNMQSILGSNPDTMGPAQISCRVWRGVLKEAKIIHACEELLEEPIAIYAAAYIIRKIMYDYRSRMDHKLLWSHVLTYYRRGVRWKVLDHGYFYRVKCFGAFFSNYWAVKRDFIGV